MSSVQKFQKSQVCFSFLWFTLPSFFCNWSTILIHPIALFSCNLLPPPYISLAFWLQEYSPKTLVILITPPPIDEEGRNEYARYDFFFLITAQSFQPFFCCNVTYNRLYIPSSYFSFNQFHTDISYIKAYQNILSHSLIIV